MSDQLSFADVAAPAAAAPAIEPEPAPAEAPRAVEHVPPQSSTAPAEPEQSSTAPLTYRERRARKAEKLREWAGGREAKSAAAFEASHDAVAGIPFGQPILVGHHSERGHRAAIARSDRAMHAAVEHSSKASDFASRADNIERAAREAIYSDDPDALDRLREKLAGLEAKREHIKQVNKAARAGTLTDEQRAELAAANRHAPIPGKHGGFPAYHLENLSGQISSTRKRIEQLAAPERGRWIDARYEGNCRKCGTTIPKGGRALFFKRSHAIECEDCNE